MKQNSKKETTKGLSMIESFVGKPFRKDLNLEKAIIGACLVDEMGYPIASQLIDSDNFYYPTSKKVWSKIEKLHSDGVKIDLISASDAETMDYVMDASMTVSSISNLESHCKILYEQYMERTFLQRVFDSAMQVGDNDIFEVVDDLEKGILGLFKFKNDNLDTGESIVQKMIAQSKASFDRGSNMPGNYFTGLKKFDEMMGGLEYGDLMVIAARPGMGKSSIQNNVNQYCVMNNISCFSGSGELSNEKMGFRLVAGLTGISTKDVETGSYLADARQEVEVSKAFDLIKKSKVFFYAGNLSISMARRKVLLHKSLHGTRLFMFDRVGLFTEVRNAKDDVQARNNVLAALRALAISEQVSIIVFSQLTKEPEKRVDKRPVISDLYGGTGGPANVTKAVLIYRPQGYGFEQFPGGPFEGEQARGKAELISDKNTFGGLGSVLVNFNPLTQTFFEDGDLIDDDFKVYEAPNNLNDIPF